jgi:methyl-accepting chemotaxis protein WspA
MKRSTRFRLSLLIFLQFALVVLSVIAFYESGWSILFFSIFSCAILSLFVGFLAGRSFALESRQQVARLAQMKESLTSLVGAMNEIGDRLGASLSQLEKSLRQLSDSIGKQSAAVNEISGTARRITSGAEALLQTMEQVSPVVRETETLVSQGQKGVNKMESAARKLEFMAESVGASLEGIQEKSGKIGGVIGAISKVSARTGLLSFNAAIEAEKAGEFGQGFAVVGREVRQLSDQAEIAAIDLDRMLKAMNSALSAGKIEAEKFREQLAGSTDSIRDIGTKLIQILSGIQTLTPHLEVAIRSVQIQSTNAGEIVEAVNGLKGEAAQTVESLDASFGDVKKLLAAAEDLQKRIASVEES